jgi:hypothetical protein
MLAVALKKAVLQQSRATSFAPVQGFATDERQVPVRLGWPAMFRPLEDGAHIDLLLGGDALCNNRLEHRIIAVNIRREPKRDTESVLGALRRSCFIGSLLHGHTPQSGHRELLKDFSRRESGYV